MTRPDPGPDPGPDPRPDPRPDPGPDAGPDLGPDPRHGTVCGPDGASGQPDGIWTRAEIDSPCVRICVIHPQAQICIGCNRTRDEIADWSRMSPARRRAIMAELPGRTAQLRQRRGGRAARLYRDAE